MRIHLHGGFGEKGRTSVGFEAGGAAILIDCGINTSVARSDPAYYPAIAPDALARLDAIIVTHAHEDHIGALGWCVANGFRGRVLMTPETRAEADATLAVYAEPAHRSLARDLAIEVLPAGGEIGIGPFRLRTGRSGHVVGGVWCAVAAGGREAVHCGDVVPASPVFAFDPVPRCDAILIDASYGDDPISAGERARAVLDWVAAHPACVLPTPLSGRSVELLTILPDGIAIAALMREALVAQLEAAAWLCDGAGERAGRRLAAAIDWHEHEPLPGRPLICHDGMGMGGPSRVALEKARAARHPVLFTGHVPTGSPGDLMRREGLADWCRFPTHPTLPENLAIAAAAGARLIIGHSAEPATLAGLKRHLPSLRDEARTGDLFEI